DHSVNDGRIFFWDNPPPTGHPGEDYNCRCHAGPPELSAIYQKALRALLLSILAKYAKRIQDTVFRIKKKKKPEEENPAPKKPEGEDADGRKPDKLKPSVNNPESLRGRSIKEVEELADKEFLPKGWTKKPLKKGEGVRYYNDKGGSFEINRGYPNSAGGNKLHKGPYIKTTVGNKKVWIPLENNPELKRY
ncbi:MAG: hypothetical protein AAF195_04525, partial [Pseudomonadota bacterium]